jgi:hypothetical protein
MKMSDIRSIWPRLSVALGLRRPEPARKPRATFPRDLCPLCFGTFAVNSKGAWPHKCTPKLLLGPRA